MGNKPNIPAGLYPLAPHHELAVIRRAWGEAIETDREDVLSACEARANAILKAFPESTPAAIKLVDAASIGTDTLVEVADRPLDLAALASGKYALISTTVLANTYPTTN